ncbi:unnamed protein product [Cunninghamella blakesleeana]
MFSCSNIKKEELSAIDQCVLKLSLSSIINMISPAIKEITMKCFTIPIIEQLENHPIININGLEDDVTAKFDKVLSLGGDIDEITCFILNEKIALIRKKQKGSQMYRMLSIVEQIVENLNLWYKDGHESEATFYRRFATLMDIIFKGTCIELAEKIDLLLKFEGNQSIELSSNEWKKSNVNEGVILKQQDKNLRINASILLNLISEYGVEFNKLMAMDWIGNIGYLYMLEKTDAGIIIARLINTLMIPTDISNLGSFKTTLCHLFSFKDFITDICNKINKRSMDIEVNKKLFNITHRNSIHHDMQQPNPSIFFYPQINTN